MQLTNVARATMRPAKRPVRQRTSAPGPPSRKAIWKRPSSLLRPPGSSFACIASDLAFSGATRQVLCGSRGNSSPFGESGSAFFAHPPFTPFRWRGIRNLTGATRAEYLATICTGKLRMSTKRNAKRMAEVAARAVYTIEPHVRTAQRSSGKCGRCRRPPRSGRVRSTSGPG
jgi:hypothetical protein